MVRDGRNVAGRWCAQVGIGENTLALMRSEMVGSSALGMAFWMALSSFLGPMSRGS